MSVFDQNKTKKIYPYLRREERLLSASVIVSSSIIISSSTTFVSSTQFIEGGGLVLSSFVPGFFLADALIFKSSSIVGPF